MLKDKVSFVIVTYNRSKLLKKCLAHLTSFSSDNTDKIYVVDNSSTDDSQDVILSFSSKFDNIRNIQLKVNSGGAGGFEVGCRLAYKDGAQWICMLDDDVLIDPRYHDVIKKFPEVKCFIAVREDLSGALAEYSAIKFDYANPLRINPKVSTIARQYSSRQSLPELLKVDSGSFEGFFVNRSVIEKVGFPNKEFFIFGDDTDYSLRIKKSGFQIYAARDARAVRQLPYVPALKFDWKFYYRWRNFFALHFIYGENIFVKSRPLVMTLGLFFFCLSKGDALLSFKIFKDSISLFKQLRDKSQFY